MVVNKLREKYLDDANKEADWSARFGPNHLAAVNLRNQMKGILASIREELVRLGETYRSDLEIAKAQSGGRRERACWGCGAVAGDQPSQGDASSARELGQNIYGRNTTAFSKSIPKRYNSSRFQSPKHV